MKSVLHYWPIIIACAWGIGWAHGHLLDDAARDEKIRVLQTIAVQEHPAYSAMLFPGVK